MITFVLSQLDSLGRNEIASRLTLNCMDAYVEPQKLRDITVTILDVGEIDFFFLELPLHVITVLLLKQWKMIFLMHRYIELLVEFSDCVVLSVLWNCKIRSEFTVPVEQV